MKVFLSWSGERSKKVALALRGWLPLMLHYIEPWMSEVDIPAGDRWAAEVGKELEASAFGIICLTPENLTQPWILFEAGALAKSLSASAVCPFLLGVELSDLAGPLAQFQGKKVEPESVLEILQAIDAKATQSNNAARIAELFEVLWPKLEARLQAIPRAAVESPAPPRSQADVLEELVSVVRSLEHRITAFESTSHRIAKNATKAPPRRSVTLIVDKDSKMPHAGASFKILPVSASFVTDTARAFGLIEKDFNVGWFLFDEVRDRSLDFDDTLNILQYFGSAEPVVKLSNVPF